MLCPAAAAQDRTGMRGDLVPDVEAVEAKIVGSRRRCPRDNIAPTWCNAQIATERERALLWHGGRPSTIRNLPHHRFHDLRHACATFMLAQGVPLRVVSEWLGHSQIGLTADSYGHVLSAAKQGAANQMQALLA
jgi:integrase